MEFIALDVETANADAASICQIGLARVVDGVLTEEWKTFVDPNDYFSPVNIDVHGITEETVAGAPSWQQVGDMIRGYLDGRVVVTHTHFDRISIAQACERHVVPTPECSWLDSARVARRAWPQFAQRGYGLANVCKHIGYEFQHHDAMEDAKAAAMIMCAAMAESGLDIEGWLERVQRPISPSSGQSSAKPITAEANPDGLLFGEVVVFTGALLITRREAAELAARAGCEVAAGVNKKTTLLVVGDQDVDRLAGHEKSSKHRKAEELVSKGHPLRIVRETDFQKIVALAS